jgi:chromosome segregation ATPase
MAQYVPLGPMPGVTDLISLLEFLKDEKSVTKHLKQIEDARKKLNDIVKAVGKAGEIDSLRSSAKAAHNQALFDLEEAKKEAAGIRQKANDFAARSSEKIKEAQVAHDAAVKKSIAHLEAWETRLKQLEKSVTEAQVKADVQAARAEQLQAEAKSLITEHRAKLKAIEELMGRIR